MSRRLILPVALALAPVLAWAAPENSAKPKQEAPAQEAPKPQVAPKQDVPVPKKEEPKPDLPKQDPAKQAAAKKESVKKEAPKPKDGSQPAFAADTAQPAFDPATVTPQHLDAAKFQAPEGLEVTLWAASPMLFNPANMDVDAAGRIWVSEGVNYRRHEGRRRDHRAWRPARQPADPVAAGAPRAQA